MPFKIKNTSAFPLDVATTSGPTILPAGGEITVELDALNAEIWRQSPYGEISETDAAPAAPPKQNTPAKGKAKKEVDPALAKLRADYEELFGKKPFAGWKADQLQVKIDEKLAE